MPPKRVIKINNFWRVNSLSKVNFQLKTSIIDFKKKKIRSIFCRISFYNKFTI